MGGKLLSSLTLARSHTGAAAVLVDESKSRVDSLYPTETKRGHRQLSLICGLLHLQRAGLIDPIFVKLDAILFGKSTSSKPGPKLVAWRDEFPADEMGKRSKVKQVDEFINRVTREFADLVGVDAERVAVDFRISSEASKQAREP
jgi:hypothetical protein